MGNFNSITMHIFTLNVEGNCGVLWCFQGEAVGGRAGDLQFIHAWLNRQGYLAHRGRLVPRRVCS